MFVNEWMKNAKLYLPTPVLEAHTRIAKRSLFTQTYSYPYYNAEKNTIDVSSMLEFLMGLDKHAVIVMHASGHKPTGFDPNVSEWDTILNVCKEREHLPFFIVGYQGVASGNIGDDVYPVRKAMEEGMQFMAINSFSASMGLYGERIGSLSIGCSDIETSKKVRSQITLQARRLYSAAPLHGGRIVSRILESPEYFNLWHKEMEEMAERIKSVRKGLHSRLARLNAKGNWDHLLRQKGFFSAIGLKEPQCARLCKERDVYVPKTGFVNLAGVNSGNIDYVAESIKDIVA